MLRSTLYEARGRWWGGRACASVALVLYLGIGCGGDDGDAVDDTPRPDLVTVDSVHAKRVAAGQPSPLFLDLVLKNATMNPVLQPVSMAFTAGATTAEFNLQPATTTIVGCTQPNPWAVAAGTAKAVRMRLDLRTDPAVLLVACTFDPGAVGIDDAKSRMFTTARKGAAPSADFAGPLATSLVLLLDAPCTPASCADHALVQASAAIAPP